jgi:hypothetical protein
VVERGVHRSSPSIFLIQIIIPFRLIEHHFGKIVNVIEDEVSVQLRRSTGVQAGISGQSRKENEMSILSSIGRIAIEYNAARTRYQTERAIRALPIELQKDIGWPEITDCTNHDQNAAGFRAGGK